MLQIRGPSCTEVRLRTNARPSQCQIVQGQLDWNELQCLVSSPTLSPVIGEFSTKLLVKKCFAMFDPVRKTTASWRMNKTLKAINGKYLVGRCSCLAFLLERNIRLGRTVLGINTVSVI
jgi:hypothetical protein